MKVAASIDVVQQRHERERRTRRTLLAVTCAALVSVAASAATAKEAARPAAPAKPTASAEPAPAKPAEPATIADLDLSNMTMYWFGLLSRGPGWTPEKSARVDSMQAGHMSNIGRMWEGGWLLAAGPFKDAGPLRGVFIFRPDSIDVLRRESAKDPMIRAGRLQLDLWQWFAPKGLGERYNRRAKEQPGRADSMVVVQLAFLKAGEAPALKDPAETQRLQVQHVRNIFRLLGSGTMPMGGPFTEGGSYRGVCIFTLDAEAARKQLADDPFVKSDHLVIEHHPLWIADGVLP